MTDPKPKTYCARHTIPWAKPHMIEVLTKAGQTHYLTYDASHDSAGVLAVRYVHVPGGQETPAGRRATLVVPVRIFAIWCKRAGAVMSLPENIRDADADIHRPTQKRSRRRWAAA